MSDERLVGPVLVDVEVAEPYVAVSSTTALANVGIEAVVRRAEHVLARRPQPAGLHRVGDGVADERHRFVDVRRQEVDVSEIQVTSTWSCGVKLAWSEPDCQPVSLKFGLPPSAS